MEDSNEKEQVNNVVNQIKTFPVPFSIVEIKDDISISTKSPSK